MRTIGRRALLAAVLPVLLLPAAASAGCVTVTCAQVPGSVAELLRGGPGGGGGNGDGVLCVFVKYTEGPPEGWGGDPNDSAPYIWTETQRWGLDHQGQYQVMECGLLCPPPPPDPVDVEVCLTVGPGR
jgi:hypothetical protein